MHGLLIINSAWTMDLKRSRDPLLMPLTIPSMGKAWVSTCGEHEDASCAGKVVVLGSQSCLSTLLPTTIISAASNTILDQAAEGKLQSALEALVKPPSTEPLTTALLILVIKHNHQC